jgi:hypothetical protein
MAATEMPVPLNTQSPESFVYDQLDSSTLSIRLLELLPYQEETEDPQNPHEICCNIATKTFDSKPKYDALSYTWGTEALTMFIKLNGRCFQVKENLYSALCHLRKQGIRMIWIDAICICQNDASERNSQVSIMDFIYSRAQRVIVWLGHPISKIPFKDHQRSSSVDVDYLRNHPYWSRLWILQEIGLAHEVKVCLNTGMYDWASFEFNIMYLARDQAQKVFTLRENRHQLHRLEQLIENFQDVECAEPRDKIFGFLDLVDDPWSHALTVNYEMSMFDLYASVLEIHQTTIPLHDVNNIHKSVDRSVRLVKFSQLLQQYLGPKVYHYAKMPTLPKNPRMFEARGFVASEILHLGPTYSDAVRSPREIKAWKQCFHVHYNQASQIEILKKSYDDCYWSSLAWEKLDEKVCNVNSKVSFGFRWNAEESAEFKRLSKDEPVGACVLPGDPQLFLGTETVVGFAPSQAQVGDMICQFWGCDVTIVLRPQGEKDCYQIVGSAYVSIEGRVAAPIDIINLDLERWADYSRSG